MSAQGCDSWLSGRATGDPGKDSPSGKWADKLPVWWTVDIQAQKEHFGFIWSRGNSRGKNSSFLPCASLDVMAMPSTGLRMGDLSVSTNSATNRTWDRFLHM